MAFLYTQEGRTLQQIGDTYGVTRERVRQILARLGVVRRPAGGKTAGKRG